MRLPALFGLKFFRTTSIRCTSPKYRSMDDRSSAFCLLVGTVALSRMISMIGRPTNVAWFFEPGISPVITKNVPGRLRSFISGTAIRN